MEVRFPWTSAYLLDLCFDIPGEALDDGMYFGSLQLTSLGKES
jgi:hypothetical protein